MKKLDEAYRSGYEKATSDFANKLFDWNQTSSKKVPLAAVRTVKESMEADMKYEFDFKFYDEATPIKRFVEQIKTEESVNDEDVLKYTAGRVDMIGGRYIPAYQQRGAEDTFSVGQPVYDAEGNLMGYLGITLFNNLDYSTGSGLRIPVETWEICLPTKFCQAGKKVYTYWQNRKMIGDNE